MRAKKTAEKSATKKNPRKEDTLLVIEEVVEVTKDRPVKVFGNGFTEEVGVTGISERNDGVVGVSIDCAGVRGKSTNGHGVIAESLTNYALVARGEKAALLEGDLHIRGTASITGKLNAEVTGEDEAVRGHSPAGIGVHGKSTSGRGVVAESLTNYALVAIGENGSASLVGYVKIVGDTHITGCSESYALNVTAAENNRLGAVTIAGSTNIMGTSGRAALVAQANSAEGSAAALFRGPVDIEGNLTGQTVTALENKILDLQATIERICRYLASISSENSLPGISLSTSDSLAQ